MLRPPPSDIAEPDLSPQQQDVLRRVLDGENLFITGPAGSGKSVLLRAIVRAFRQREEASGEALPELPASAPPPGGKKAEVRKRRPFSMLAVTASTGKAAE